MAMAYFNRRPKGEPVPNTHLLDGVKYLLGALRCLMQTGELVG